MAMASRITIAEVEEIVDEIDPNRVQLPGIFVDYVVQGKEYLNRHEKRVIQEGETFYVNGIEQKGKIREKMQIAKNAMQLVEDGDYINLGIGIPQLISHQISIDQSKRQVMIHSENGILGIKGYPSSVDE